MAAHLGNARFQADAEGMAGIAWSRNALSDLRTISEYIAQSNDQAARANSRRLLDAGDALTDFPNRGRPIDGGQRELVTVRPF
ncbi:type II toxin-antitoxin system RelE/ParE family toxin [uncultured Sphingomonas sp.]|uniref:type II toxin-antitoxin system RelE/ParE family toxin n=1 Tax=uncultured Sphingomonas sp. TaxID=158754 RepID=UPI0035CC0D66